MDEPDIDWDRHIQALRGLRRINQISGSSRILWPSIRALARKMNDRPLRVLDVAAGGGDVGIRILQRASREGLPVEVELCDVSPKAIAHARQEADRKGVRIHAFELDVLNDPLPGGYDVITTSLFLHHLDDDQATQFLRRAAEAAGRLVLINDLRRSLYGLLLAYGGTRVLSRSKIVHVDGIRSVRAAYTIQEVKGLAAAAGLHNVKVERKWPCRFLLSWSRG